MASLKSQPEAAARAAKHELAAAQRIETLQIAHWCALLSHRPALAIVRAELTQHMALPEDFERLAEESDSGSGAAPSEALLTAIAEALYRGDVTRQALAQVDECVRHGLSVKPQDHCLYLAELERARLAHRQAKHALVLSNLGLVRNLAKRYVGAAMPIAELVQEGSIALLRAVELFDYRRGLRFSTYAVWWIRNAFHRGLSEQTSTVRAPLEALRGASKASRFAWASYGRTGLMPDSAQVAEHLGESASTVERMGHGSQARSFSLDRNVESDGGTTFLDQLVDRTPSVEAQVSAAIMRERLEHGLTKLPDMEAAILRRKFGFSDGVETPLSVIARDYNLSYERTLQLSRQALRRLRHDLGRRGIAESS